MLLRRRALRQIVRLEEAVPISVALLACFSALLLVIDEKVPVSKWMLGICLF